jgi:hypothetical protein
VDAGLDTLATALYVTADDLIKAWPGLPPARPAVGIAPQLTDAELVTLEPLRQTIESINQTFKGQLDLERHGGRSTAGVIARVLQRILALTTAIWLNDKLGLPVHTARSSPTTTDNPSESIV